MFVGINTPTILVPHSIGEAINNKKKNPNSIFWAGGTFIMGSSENFAQDNITEIISLSEISELCRISRTDRYLEFGSMVPIQRLLDKGAFALGENTRKAVGRIASSIIRNQATTGGALCANGRRFFLSAILSVLDAQAELRFFAKHSPSKWYPIYKIYDRDGNFIFKDKALLTRIRINTEYKPYQFFRSIGSPMRNPEETVIFAAQFSISQTNISSIHICTIFPNAGFHVSTDFENKIKALPLPISPLNTMQVADLYGKELRTQHPKATDLQIEKTKRILIAILIEANSAFLAN